MCNYEKLIVGLINFTLLYLYCALIYWVSDQSKLAPPIVFNHQDKLLHVAAYFVMGVLAWRTVNSISKNLKTLAITTLVFCSLYGMSDEWHQSFVPGRNPDAIDWLADTLGGMLSVLLLTTLYNRKHKSVMRPLK